MIFGAAVRPGGRPSATLRRRVESAATFASRFTAPLFVPTGAEGRFGPSEAAVMQRLLTEHSVAAEHILLEESGTDTLSSARAVVRLLHGRGVRAPVFAASSAYHLPRCVMLLRMFGVPAHAAGPPWLGAGPGWAYWWIREALALPYDAVAATVARMRGR